MQSENKISLLPLSLSRWETYQKSKLYFRDGCPREIFFERNSASEDNGKLCPTIRATHYKSGDNQPLIKQLPITRGRSTEPWRAGTVAPSRRLGDKDDIKIIEDFYPDRIREFSENSPTPRSDRSGLKVGDGSRIRRLTPVETERLMSLPDGWTSKGIMNDKEVEISDSSRYKLCGNGVVVNVVEEILKQIIKVL